MKNFTFALVLAGLLLTAALLTAGCGAPKHDGTPDAKAAAALAQRVIPGQAGHFSFKTLPEVLLPRQHRLVRLGQGHDAEETAARGRVHYD